MPDPNRNPMMTEEEALALLRKETDVPMNIERILARDMLSYLTWAIRLAYDAGWDACWDKMHGGSNG